MAQGGFSAIMVLVWLAFVVVVVASWWRLFTKAGEPGWAAIIPIYNTYIMIKIGGNPWWYLLLLFVPLVNFVIVIKIMVDVASAFGKGLGFGLGLAILSFIFAPILAFGDATYQGAGESSGGATA